MSDKFQRLFGEAALWTGATLLSIGVAMFAAYLLSGAAFGSGALTVGMVALSVTISLTWGAWISLTWSRSRGLRAVLKAVTLFPAFLLLAMGVLGFYVGLGSLVFWIIVTVSAFGTLAVAALLWRQFPRTGARTASNRLASGFLLYPLLTGSGASAVGTLWWWYLAGPVHYGWRDLFELSTIFVTVLAIELCSTIVPAAAAMLCNRINRLTEKP